MQQQWKGGTHVSLGESFGILLGLQEMAPLEARRPPHVENSGLALKASRAKAVPHALMSRMSRMGAPTDQALGQLEQHAGGQAAGAADGAQGLGGLAQVLQGQQVQEEGRHQLGHVLPHLGDVQLHVLPVLQHPVQAARELLQG